MAEFSRPQPGLFPADGDDCGAYTANEWAPVLIAANRSSGMFVTGAAAPPGLPGTQLFPNVGVYYAVANRLEVTSPGASQISINTGASLVDGRLHTNDTAHTAIAITNPAANPRIDRVVVRQNYTAIDYTSVNAPALVVDFNTARICIISGAEAGAPVEPTMTQDEDRATYWDIPLAQYQISVAGVITNLTDEREWVDAETKELWVPALSGWNETDGTLISLAAQSFAASGASGAGPYLVLPDAKNCYAYGRSIIPINYIDSSQSLTVEGVAYAPNTNNIYAYNYLYSSVCGENWNIRTDTNALIAEAMDDGGTPEYSCVRSLGATNVQAGDISTFMFRRAGDQAQDTLGADVKFFGWRVTYLSWGRR
jgi:hypothetical protein